MIAALSIGFICACNAQNSKTYQDINRMWNKFSQAFDTLDHQTLKRIHSKDLIRIAEGKYFLDRDRYLATYKIDFEMAKTNNSKRAISFRFHERIHNDSLASEKGVYKLTMGNNPPYYGKFHVLLKKEKGYWKIFMDYDSNEGGTIGEDDYKKGSATTDLSRFVKK